MVNENIKLIIENKKPIEIVQEVNNEIPSFEEFMRTYENDGNVNYADLNGSDVGEVQSYGPCNGCSGSNRSLTFKLKIILENCVFGKKGMTVCNINDALSEAEKIVAETGHWKDEFFNYFSQEDRRKLFNKIDEKIKYHKRGNKVDTEVCKNGIGVSEGDSC